jgi:hypothetical protein
MHACMDIEGAISLIHLCCVLLQFGQRYVEEQDDKTVTEWMDKQVSGTLASAVSSDPCLSGGASSVYQVV